MEVDRFVDILDAKQADNDRAGKQEFVYGQLAERLRKYCRGGEYGKWFHGKMNINFERPFVVLELEQLNAMKDLREVILLLLISIMERQFYLGDRKIPKLLLCDEAWDLFRNPNTAAFIETATGVCEIQWFNRDHCTEFSGFFAQRQFAGRAGYQARIAAKN